MGNKDHNDGPLPSRGERDGRALPSQDEGGANRPRSRRAASVVLAPAVCHVGHKDNHQARHQRIPSGPSVWRGPRGSRRTSDHSSSFRRPTRSSARVRTRRPPTRSGATPANRDVGSSTPGHPPPSRPATLHPRLRQARRRTIQSSVALHRTFQSSFKGQCQLQSGHPRSSK